MRRVYLIRHGATAANERRAYCGAADIPLSAAGRERLVRLRETARYPAADGLRIYTSGMRRTEETLALLFGEIPHSTVPGLQEMNFGAFELHSYSELKEEPAYLTWISGNNEKKRCPHGESGEEMTRRVLKAFYELLAEGEFLAVTHGGPIAAVMSDLFPAEEKNRYEWQPSCGCGYRIKFDGGCAVCYDRIPFSGVCR